MLQASLQTIKKKLFFYDEQRLVWATRTLLASIMSLWASYYFPEQGFWLVSSSFIMIQLFSFAAGVIPKRRMLAYGIGLAVLATVGSCLAPWPLLSALGITLAISTAFFCFYRGVIIAMIAMWSMVMVVLNICLPQNSLLFIPHGVANLAGILLAYVMTFIKLSGCRCGQSLPASVVAARRLPYVQFALKGALVSLLSLWIAHSLHIHQSYWVLFGAITVLKFNIGASFQRGKERLWGTFAGVLASLLLAIIFLHWTSGVYLLIPICIFFAVYYLYHYFISMFFMTLIFVLTIGVMSAHPVDFAIARIGDTLIGVAIAGVVSLLIWPKSATETLQTEIAHFVTALEARNIEDMDRWSKAIEATLESLQHEPGKKRWHSRDRALLRSTLDELRRMLIYLKDVEEGAAYAEAMKDYTQALARLSRLRAENQG